MNQDLGRTKNECVNYPGLGQRLLIPSEPTCVISNACGRVRMVWYPGLYHFKTYDIVQSKRFPLSGTVSTYRCKAGRSMHQSNNVENNRAVLAEAIP